MIYKIIIDNGKPYDVIAINEDDLKKTLKEFYDYNKDNENFNLFVLNDKDEDISESQFITEMIGEIMGGD